MDKIDRLVEEYQELIEINGPAVVAETLEKYESVKFGWCSDKDTTLIIFALIGAFYCGQFKKGHELYWFYKHMQRMKKNDRRTKTAN